MTRLKQDRTRKSGYRGSLNAQDLPMPPADPRQRLLDETKNYLGQLNLWSSRWKRGNEITVKTTRWACENLLQLLEGVHKKAEPKP